MDKTALFSLAGVVVGAVIAMFPQLYLEKKRQKLEVRRAARLIDSDLMFAEVAAEICVEKKTWWVKDDRLTSEGWEQYRYVIASKLSWRNWVAVTVAVRTIRDLQGARDAALKIQLAKMAIDPKKVGVLASAERLGLDIVKPAPAIPEAMVTRIKPMLAHIKAGRDALAPLAQNPVKRPY